MGGGGEGGGGEVREGKVVGWGREWGKGRGRGWGRGSEGK